MAHQSLSGVYFSNLAGGEKVYALIDPLVIPVIENNKIRNIIYNTLPGVDTGVWESGRVININMGGEYEDIVELFFPLSGDTFKANLRNKRNSGDDFIYSPDDGIMKYKVSFSGGDSLVFNQPNNPSETCKMKLIILQEL